MDLNMTANNASQSIIKKQEKEIEKGKMNTKEAGGKKIEKKKIKH